MSDGKWNKDASSSTRRVRRICGTYQVHTNIHTRNIFVMIFVGSAPGEESRSRLKTGDVGLTKGPEDAERRTTCLNAAGYALTYSSNAPAM